MKSTEERLGYWRQHVETFEHGGLKRQEYCQANGITVSGLDYWRRRFRELDPADPPSSNGWIPLKIGDDSILDPGSVLCLKIGRLAIEVRPGFNRELLVDVLRAVGSIC
jgi:hypothetical protein